MAPFHEHVRAAAGSGEHVFDEEAEIRIEIRRALLPAWTKPEELVCITAKGDSMEPTIRDGELIVLDRSAVELVDDELFVVDTDDGLVVKRIRRVRRPVRPPPPGMMGLMVRTPIVEWHLVSDNERASSRRVAETDRVVGRVAWTDLRPRKESA